MSPPPLSPNMFLCRASFNTQSFSFGARRFVDVLEESDSDPHRTPSQRSGQICTSRVQLRYQKSLGCRTKSLAGRSFADSSQRHASDGRDSADSRGVSTASSEATVVDPRERTIAAEMTRAQFRRIDVVNSRFARPETVPSRAARDPSSLSTERRATRGGAKVSWAESTEKLQPVRFTSV